eukprot:CAMPEP_0170167832 /NCGR_PEP_ID=MMETSP0040_2-20121228/1115_1 /TAXON_ID=641309 /ORGANISM="Lotharella oceanica, Strain CCMP622" /LENGTH=191 /DNA_ID=CAMNT_0010405963 /DNA_START=17 /DNA_END=592 /DNA_ORIENTATION=-
MAHLFQTAEKKVIYQDTRFKGSQEDMIRLKSISTTTYVGNIAYTTREEQIFELFGKVGLVKRVVMGVDRRNKTPCGFCFVEFFERKDCMTAIECLTGSKLDGQIIRCEIDHGFENGRQFGRGKGGGQVRHEKKMLSSEDKHRRRSFGHRGEYNREYGRREDGGGYNGRHGRNSFEQPRKRIRLRNNGPRRY